MKILVVDDEPHIVKLIKSRLEANHYEVITAGDGEECIKKVISEKPDLLILDVMMPVMDGYSTLITLKEMKAMGEDIPSVPVIVLTARVDEKIKALMTEEKVKAYLIKPFDSKVLLEIIQDIEGKLG